MNKRILFGVSSLALVGACVAVAGILAIPNSARIEATEPDATILFDKDRHAPNDWSESGSTRWIHYQAESSNGGYSDSWIQTQNANSVELAPEDAFFRFTSTGSGYFFLRVEVAGAKTFSWDIGYTGLDEDHKGLLVLSQRNEMWGSQGTFHSSGLYNNGDHEIDVSALASPYYIELKVESLPENAVITLNSVSITYGPDSCRTARAA